MSDILASKKIEAWGLDEGKFKNLLDSRQPKSYADAVELTYELYAHKLGKEKLSTIVDKNNYYIHHISDLIKIWPDAKFIHLIRDGRDVACSYKGIHALKSDSPYVPKLPSSIGEIAQEWNQNNSLILEGLKENNASLFSLRYEDLTREPGKTLGELMRFMKLDVVSEMFAFNQVNDEPESTLDWKRLTKSPITSSQIGRYKTMLKPEEISLFNKVAGEMLNRFHYLP